MGSMFSFCLVGVDAVCRKPGVTCAMGRYVNMSTLEDWEAPNTVRLNIFDVGVGGGEGVDGDGQKSVTREGLLVQMTVCPVRCLKMVTT